MTALGILPSTMIKNNERKIYFYELHYKKFIAYISIDRNLYWGYSIKDESGIEIDAKDKTTYQSDIDIEIIIKFRINDCRRHPEDYYEKQMVADIDLITWYRKGFNDEIHGSSSAISNIEALNTAYRVGATQAESMWGKPFINISESDILKSIRDFNDTYKLIQSVK